ARGGSIDARIQEFALLTTLLLTAGLALGQAPDKSPANDKAPAHDEARAKVVALVRQLDHDELAKREAAEKALVAMGPEVLPLLPTLGPQASTEVRNRVNRVRNALVKAEVEAATRPSLVTLSGEMPVSEALAEIARQTG